MHIFSRALITKHAVAILLSVMYNTKAQQIPIDMSGPSSLCMSPLVITWALTKDLICKPFQDLVINYHSVTLV